MQKQQQKFVMDLDAILDFVFCPEEKRDVEVNIEEIYTTNAESTSMTLASRKKNESKTSAHTQHENLRYDLLRKMIDIFDDMEWDDENGKPDIQTVSEEVCFNTLLQYGFLKVV